MIILNNFLLSGFFGLVGIGMIILGYYIFNKILPIDFIKELEKGNLAVAIFIAGFLISIAIILSKIMAV